MSNNPFREQPPPLDDIHDLAQTFATDLKVAEHETLTAPTAPPPTTSTPVAMPVPSLDQPDQPPPAYTFLSGEHREPSTSTHLPPVNKAPPSPTSRALQPVASSSSQPYPAPSPNQNPRSPSPRGFVDKLLPTQRRNPLDPPPPSFLRPPPFQAQPNPSAFPPMTLFASHRYLDEGFPHVPPPSTLQPHPFFSRDVLQTDWVRFLEDIQIAAGLTGVNKVVAGVAPIAMHVPTIAGVLISKAIKGHMKGKKRRRGRTARRDVEQALFLYERDARYLGPRQ